VKYNRIVQTVAGQPWAIDEGKGRAIAEFIAFKASGGAYSREEIEARIGDKKENDVVPGKGVAVIPLHGVMFQRAGMIAEMSGGTSSEKVANAVRAATKDDKIKTIVLHIDSPGGSVYGTRELGDVVAQASQVKHVVAQVDSVAASAAYWVASQASEIVVTPGGDVGSIGVLAVHEEVSKQLEEKGVTETIISAGKYKAEGNPFEPLSEDAKDHIQARVYDAYGDFVDAVARGRNTSPQDVVDNFGQGRMLGAQNALKAGMVDRVATFVETLSRFQEDRYTKRAMSSRLARTKAGFRQ